MGLTSEVILHGLSSEDYGKFVPEDDNEFGSTPGEQADSVRTFSELVGGFGVNEQGAEETEFYGIVHFMRSRNMGFRRAHLSLLFVPFIVVERKLAQTKDLAQTMEHAADDKQFFHAAKLYANQFGETVFIFSLLSKPTTRIHSYVVYVRIAADGSFRPYNTEGQQLEAFMVIFDATGDEHKSTVVAKYILPWHDENTITEGRPRARHSSKLVDDKETGVSCNIQVALERAFWSTNCCLTYVFTLLLWLLERPDKEVQEFGTTDLYTKYHRWFTDVLSVRVKYITTRYLRVFAQLTSINTLYAVVLDHETEDLPTLQTVKTFKMNGKLVLHTPGRGRGPRVVKSTLHVHDVKNRGVYILGYDEVGLANYDLLRPPINSTKWWNLVSELEDKPGERINVDKKKVVEAEGSNKACVDLPPHGGSFSKDFTVTVDNELFRAALAANVSVEIVAYVAVHYRYRVILRKLLNHPLFVLDVESDQIPKEMIQEFWATMKVPDSMKCEWTFEPPKVVSQQQKGDYGCMWKGIAALLGHEDALSFTWLKVIESNLLWRDMARTGCKGPTYTDMMNPVQARWYLDGCVGMETIMFVLKELSPLRLVQVTKNDKTVKAYLQRNFDAPDGIPTVGLIVGWPAHGTKFVKRAQVAKQQKLFVPDAPEGVYSIQRIPESDDLVRVTWDPGRTTTEEPRHNLAHIIATCSTLFNSGAEVIVDDADDDNEHEDGELARAAKVRVKRMKHARSVFAQMKLDDAHKPLTMHAIPAWFTLDLCRDPMATTSNKGVSIKNGGIWTFLQDNKNSTKVYELQDASKPGQVRRPHRFQDPGPRIPTLPLPLSSSSTASSSSSSLPVQTKRERPKSESKDDDADDDVPLSQIQKRLVGPEQ